MWSQNRLNGLGRFIGVIERDGGDKVVEDVSLDDSVEKRTTDEAKFTIDSCGGATSKVPSFRPIVR